MRGKPYSNLLKRKKKLLREKKMKIKFLHFNSTVNLIIYIYRVVKNIIGNPIFVNLNIPRYITLYLVYKSKCACKKLRKTCIVINLT